MHKISAQSDVIVKSYRVNGRTDGRTHRPILVVYSLFEYTKNAPIGLGNTAVAITNRGLSVIRFEMWTLAKKAEHFQRFIDDQLNMFDMI